MAIRFLGLSPLFAQATRGLFFFEFPPLWGDQGAHTALLGLLRGTPLCHMHYPSFGYSAPFGLPRFSFLYILYLSACNITKNPEKRDKSVKLVAGRYSQGKRILISKRKKTFISHRNTNFHRKKGLFSVKLLYLQCVLRPFYVLLRMSRLYAFKI
jgi:hypothetical protein